MRNKKSEYATYVVEVFFGSSPSKIVKSLLSKPLQTLKELADSTSLPFSNLRNSLLLLVTHDIVLYHEEFTPTNSTQDQILFDHPNEAPTTTKYSVQLERVFLRIRLPKILSVSKDIAGPEGLLLVQTLVQDGRNLKSNLIDKVVAAEISKMSNVELNQREKMVEALEDAFLKLAEFQLISRYSVGGKLIRKGQNVEEPLKKGKKTPTLKRRAQGNDVTIPKMARVDDSMSLSNFESGSIIDDSNEVFWAINYDTFLKYLRHRQIFNYVGIQYGELVKRVIEASFLSARGTEASVHSRRLGPVNVDSICFELTSYNHSAMSVFSNSKIREIFEKVCVDFMEQEGSIGGGTFYVNIGFIMENIKKSLLHSIICQKFKSVIAGRIFNFVLQNPNVEEKIMSEMCVCSPIDCRRVIHEFLQNNLLNCNMIPKTSDRNPSKSDYYFSIDFDNACAILLNESYGSALNLFTKINFETERIKKVAAVDQSLADRHDMVLQLQNSLLLLDESILILDVFSNFD
ncbi:hypothetical protein GEMRC1_010903 [Eukaryota sp. GEM-RC1]